MCVLHIDLDTDNLDLILESTNLPIYQVYRKGESHKYRKGKVFETNLISCSISDKDWNDFEGQVQDMISFLEKYHTDLQSIKDNFNIANWQFDLPYANRLSNEIFNQNDFLPPELLFQSGRLGIGINLSLYHKSEQDVD
jgi:hypothetical protein